MALWGKIEKELTTKMQEAFQSTNDRKKAVHLTAAAGAGVVAALPMGADAIALRACEVVMVLCIAASYGEKLTKSAAKGLMLSSFAQLVGEKAAITALEAAEAAKVASIGTGVGPVAAYGIKSSIAVGLIEAVGWMVISYYEKKGGVGAVACDVAECIGAVADIRRAVDLAAHQKAALTEGSVARPISFTGRVEGEAHGHTESYWSDRLKNAIKTDNKTDIKYYSKWLAEAIANRPAS